MIKNIVFDIGNVLVDFGWEKFYKSFNFTDDEYNRLVKATVASPFWNEIDRGVMTEDEILEGFIKNDPGIEDVLRKAYENFDGLLTMFEYTKGWIIDLHDRGYKVYCLSNMSHKAIRECGQALSFLDSVDGYILSCNEKQIKPEEKIYESLFKKLSLKPSECIFFDDSQANIDTANRLGMHGYVFTGVKEAEEVIERVTKEEAANGQFESKYTKPQRVAALVCVILIVLLFVSALVFSLIDTEWGHTLARASIGLMVGLPILIWIYIWMVGKLTHKKTIADFNFFKK